MKQRVKVNLMQTSLIQLERDIFLFVLKVYCCW